MSEENELFVELAVQPRNNGYTAIIIENEEQVEAEDDVWQEWIRSGSLL